MSLQTDIVTALAGIASDRVYPEVAPQDMALPFVVYVRKNRVPLMTLLGPDGAVNSDMIFECYAATKADALTVADAVRAAIRAALTTVLPIQYEMPVSTENYEPQTLEYMEPVGYGFWHNA